MLAVSCGAVLGIILQVPGFLERTYRDVGQKQSFRKCGAAKSRLEDRTSITLWVCFCKPEKATWFMQA
jgi:hypothetical protein